ncbi:MAG: DUF3795 domain-containing protein [Eubacteriales bacterium]
MKKYPSIGVCGLDCGLCPRYYTEGASRCPGCDGIDFNLKHPSCSYITCCVKKKGLEVCGECEEFPCSKFKSNEEYQNVKDSSSYPTYKKVLPNLNFIKKHGIEKFMEQQTKRIEILEKMLENFDDGRSRSYFCKAANLLEIPVLERKLEQAKSKIKSENIEQNDKKNKSKILKTILDEAD